MPIQSGSHLALTKGLVFRAKRKPKTEIPDDSGTQPNSYPAPLQGGTTHEKTTGPRDAPGSYSRSHAGGVAGQRGRNRPARHIRHGDGRDYEYSRPYPA